MARTDSEDIEHRLPLNDGTEHVFVGRFLGRGTSQKPIHSFHAGEYADPARRERCPACRWFEVEIYSVTSGGYVVYYVGRSIVPGETQRRRYDFVETHFEVVEVLTTRRKSPDGHTNVFLTVPASRALAQAAARDDDLEAAYVDRAAV